MASFVKTKIKVLNKFSQTVDLSRWVFFMREYPKIPIFPKKPGAVFENIHKYTIIVSHLYYKNIGHEMNKNNT